MEMEVQAQRVRGSEERVTTIEWTIDTIYTTPQNHRHIDRHIFFTVVTLTTSIAGERSAVIGIGSDNCIWRWRDSMGAYIVLFAMTLGVLNDSDLASTYSEGEFSELVHGAYRDT